MYKHLQILKDSADEPIILSDINHPTYTAGVLLSLRGYKDIDLTLKISFGLYKKKGRRTVAME